MAGKIIMLVCMWICGGLFLGIGLYARRRRDPMWFWSGVKVPRESVPQMCRPITGLTAAYFSSTPCPGGWAGFWDFSIPLPRQRWRCFAAPPALGG